MHDIDTDTIHTQASIREAAEFLADNIDCREWIVGIEQDGELVSYHSSHLRKPALVLKDQYATIEDWLDYAQPEEGLTEEEIVGILEDSLRDYDHVVWSAEPEDLDTDTDKRTDDMETFTLTNDDGRDVRFTGEIIAEASSRRHTGNSQSRWTELTLYRTASGKFVCYEVGRTMWQGERNRHKVTVCTDHEGVIDAFGDGPLAKDLYSSADIDATISID